MKQVALYVNWAARSWLVKYRKELVGMFEWRITRGRGEVGTAQWMSGQDLDRVVEILDEMSSACPAGSLERYELVTVDDEDTTSYATNKDPGDEHRLWTETHIVLDGNDLFDKGDERQ